MTIHELHGTWGRGRVSELGACVLSWEPAGRGEVLWMAREAQLRVGHMWHGGIPVCAPWFGSGRGEVTVPFTHGLVSRVPWAMDLLEQSDDGARMVLTLDSPAVAHLPGADLYPPDLGYRLDARMDRRRLAVALTVTSPTRAVVLDLALHPYFTLDARGGAVEGLDGVAYVDKAADGAVRRQAGAVTFAGLTDRVYASAGPVAVVDAAGGREVRVSTSGAEQLVVWNPGKDKAAEIPDLAAGEWERFVCVEAGCVLDRAVRLEPEQSHTLTTTIGV